MEVLYIVILIVLVFAGVLVWLIVDRKLRKKRSTCPKCKTLYDFDEDIVWIVESKTYEDEKAKEMVLFTCTCPDCGYVHEFKKSFTSARIVKKGSGLDQKEEAQFYNLEQLVRRAFLTEKEKKK